LSRSSEATAPDFAVAVDNRFRNSPIRSLHGNRRLNDPLPCAGFAESDGLARSLSSSAASRSRRVPVFEAGRILADPCGVGCASDFATPPCETVASESPLGAAETLAATALAVDVPACFRGYLYRDILAVYIDNEPIWSEAEKRRSLRDRPLPAQCACVPAAIRHANLFQEAVVDVEGLAHQS